MEKMNYKWFLVGFVLLLFVPLVSADTLTFYHNKTLGTSDSPTAQWGFKFTTNFTGVANLTVNRVSGVTATRAILYNSTGALQTTTTILSPNTFLFSSQNFSDPTNTYYITLDNSGASYSRRYTSFSTYPYDIRNSTIAINITGNCGNNAYPTLPSCGFGELMNIEYLTLNFTPSTPPPAPSSTNASIGATDFYTGQTLLNLTVTATNRTGYQYNTTTLNGTAYLPIYQNTTELWNVSVYHNQFYFTNTSGTVTDGNFANDGNWSTYPVIAPYGTQNVQTYFYWNYNNSLGAVPKTWTVSDYNVTTSSQVYTNLTLPANASTLSSIQLRTYLTKNALTNTHYWQYYDGYNWITLRSNTENLGFGVVPRVYEQILINETFGSDYFIRILNNQNLSFAVNTTLAQSSYVLTATEFISNASLSNVNFTSIYLTNVTHYMKAGSYSINATKSGYYNKTQTVTATALATSTTNIENMTASYLNFSLRTNITNTSITNYNATFNMSTYGYSVTAETTNGSILIPALAGQWTVTINDSRYAITTFNVTVGTGITNYTGYLLTTNSIYFYVYDEITRALINYTTVNIELIGTYNSYNQTTTNGTWYKDLITPDTYSIRTSASGYTTRFDYFMLENRSSNQILLYLLNSASATNVTVTVVDLSAGGRNLENAYVYIQKYDIETNTYITREIVRTNFEGQAQFSALYNNEFYKFIVQFPFGTTLTETTPTYITSTSLTIPVTTTQAETQTWQTVYGVSGDVSYNSATQNFRFTYTDPSLSIENACLYVYNVRSNFSTVLYNSSCTTSTSATILLYTTNLTSGQYFAKGTVFIDGEEYIIDSDSYSFSSMVLWGTLGILLSALMTMIIQMMFKNPVASLIVAPLPTLAFYAFGLTALPLGVVVGACVVLWTAAILAAKWA